MMGYESLLFSSAQYFSASNIPLPATNGSAYTIEFWMYYTPKGSTPVFFSCGYSLWIQGTTIGFNTGHGDIKGIDYGSNLNNKWNHIACVMGYNDASKNKLYINGVLQSTGANYSAIHSKYISFGGQNTQWGDYSYYGYISEVRAWNYERTIIQINNNKNIRIRPQDGLVGYWQCMYQNANLANIKILDFTKNGNIATITNKSMWNSLKPPFTNNSIYFLSQDGADVKRSTNGNTLEQVGSTPYSVSMFDTYGMSDLTCETNDVVQMMNNNKYKIVMHRK